MHCGGAINDRIHWPVERSSIVSHVVVGRRDGQDESSDGRQRGSRPRGAPDHNEAATEVWLYLAGISTDDGIDVHRHSDAGELYHRRHIPPCCELQNI